MNNIIIDYQQFYKEILELHNEYRTRFFAKKLVLDDEVSNHFFHLFIVCKCVW